MPTRLSELHVVTHTHWDREWYHTAEHFRQRLVSLVDELLDAPATDDASFLLDGQAIVLEDYLAIRPERSGEISQLLRSGGLEAGPWYVLPDELIPGGEALVRNLLIGRDIVRRLRAEPPPVLYCPDSFGHPAILPDLATGFGYPLIVLWRGLGGRRAPQSDLLRWSGAAGGSAVVYHLPPAGYEFGSSLPGDPSNARARWNQIEEVLASRSATGTALLLNGADHHAKQRELDAALDALREAAAPVRIRRASLSTAARALLVSAENVDLPRIAGELRDSYGYTWTLQGTLGTRAAQKRVNALAERTLVRDVEPWIALSADGGDDAARALLDNAWRTLLQAHPHDTLCGTSIDAVALAFDARLSAVEVESHALRAAALDGMLGHDAESARAASVAWRPAVVVRNRVARPRSGVAELTLQASIASIAVGPGSAERQGVRAEPGLWSVYQVPLQILSQHERVALTESARAYPRADLVLEASALGWLDSMGGYDVRTIAHVPGVPPAVPNRVVATDDALDNGLVRIEVDVDGKVTFIDLETGARIEGLLAIERERDVGDLYTTAVRGAMPVGRSKRLGLVHRGPLRGTIAVAMDIADAADAIGAMRVTLDLDANARFVRISIQGDNRVCDQRTRLRVCTGLAAAATLADAPFHPVLREPVAIEPADAVMEHVVPTAPLHRWVARLGADLTGVLFSDGLAEYESTADGALRVTLVRAVGELSRHDLPERPGHAGWPSPTPAAQCIGPYVARFALALLGPDSADVRDEIERLADDVLLPLTGATQRSNLLAPQRAAGLELQGDGLAFSAAMPARRSGWIALRCVNRRDTPVRGVWTLSTPVHEAMIARLDETALEPAHTAGNTITFTAASRAIVTILARVAGVPG